MPNAGRRQRAALPPSPYNGQCLLCITRERVGESGATRCDHNSFWRHLLRYFLSPQLKHKPYVPMGHMWAGDLCQLAPDDLYVSGDQPVELAPNGTYTSGDPQLAPDDFYVGGGGDPSLCPDGTYVVGECELTPNGSYVGEDDNNAAGDDSDDPQ